MIIYYISCYYEIHKVLSGCGQVSLGNLAQISGSKTFPLNLSQLSSEDADISIGIAEDPVGPITHVIGFIDFVTQ